MKTLLIAIGNEIRQDDGAAQVLLRKLPVGLGWDLHAVLQLTPELAERMSHYARVIFADADAAVDQPALAAVAGSDGALSVAGMHEVSPVELVRLARNLYEFSGEALLCHLPAEAFGYGEGLTEKARMGVEAAVRLLLEEG